MCFILISRTIIGGFDIQKKKKKKGFGLTRGTTNYALSLQPATNGSGSEELLLAEAALSKNPAESSDSGSASMEGFVASTNFLKRVRRGRFPESSRTSTSWLG